MSLNITLNDVFKLTAIGDIDSAIGSVMYGINQHLTPAAIPVNRDYHGLTLFTKPQLNLQDDNVSAVRELVPLLTTQGISIPAAIRKWLDPRTPLPSSLVDDRNAFIPLLSNHLLTCSGWPDITLDYYTSKPGVYREEFGFVDGIADKYSAYNVSCTFRNMIGDPITALFLVWATYMQMVFTGTMIPYPDFIAENEIDSNTRIYRLVLDRTKRYVQKIGACGAAFPTMVPIGQAFDFDYRDPRNNRADEIQINFRCFGYTYQDHILVKEFNQTVGTFNSDMRDGVRNSRMVQIPPASLPMFKHRGYPHIDMNTLELQWFVTPDEYEATMQAFYRVNGVLGLDQDISKYQPVNSSLSDNQFTGD